MEKIISPQFLHLIKFELAFFSKKIGIYAIFLAFILLGFVSGSRFTAFSSENIYRNAPFTITFMLGLMSLMCLFLTSILAAQVLFREKDSHFSLILYATPLQKRHHLLTRFLMVFGITAFSFLIFIVGFIIGQKNSIFDASEFGQFHLWHYFQPFFLLILPNALFCSAIMCSVGWLTKNKLLVFIAGLFLYIAYMVTLIFSGSPLMAGAATPSVEAMNVSAQFDPFGLSAFLQQTLNWSAQERNTQTAALTGNLLFNRVFFIVLALLLLGFTYFRYKFSIDTNKSVWANLFGKRFKNGHSSIQELSKTPHFQALLPPPQYFNLNHRLKSILSFVKIDLIHTLKSIPFLLIMVGVAFFLSMEIYGDIDRGTRLPENYASTALMANTIITTLPFLSTLILLFYSQDLLWRSRDSNFHLMENVTPTDAAIPFISKWLSLTTLVNILILWAIIVSLFFQIAYSYTYIEWSIYGSLFYIVGLPLVLSAGLILAIQHLINNKYAGLIVATIILLTSTTTIGKWIGIKHPLLRFASPFGTKYSDMNGFGAYLDVFGWKMLFGASVTFLLVLVVLGYKSMLSLKAVARVGVKQIALFSLLITACISGFYIFKNVEIPDEKETLNWQQNYETKYRQYQNLPQPTLLAVNTSIDLYPEKNAYAVSGTYIFRNNTNKLIDTLLFYSDISVRSSLKFKNMAVRQPDAVGTEGGIRVVNDTEFGHFWLYLSKPLQPNDSLSIAFEFNYAWKGFNRHESFNAIVENGAFMRLSNYYPQLGYQSQLEIEAENERKKRNLGEKTPILTLNDPRTLQEKVNLDLQISTSKGQTAIGVGDLVNTWDTDNRQYFQYKTSEPIAFRFGVSSAHYAVQKSTHRNIGIEVYYHPNHYENVARLMENAANTLDYCEANFGKYPFKTIRFAEISSFTNGFAATAYPASIFMTEHMVFHANVKGDKQQDVINELAGHELSHEWWGAHQLQPDNREGAKFLTETLAMYTELMLVKKMYGQKRVLEVVAMHEGFYWRDRSFLNEQPLYKTLRENVHQHYSKGLVTMYQLSEILGEDKVNLALKNLFQKSIASKYAPIATDFLEELYAVSSTNQHVMIDDLFKYITTYVFNIKNTQTTKEGDNYNVSFDVESYKYREDGKGNKSNLAFSDSVNIAFHFKNNALQTKRFFLGKGVKSFSMPVPEKPEKIEIDPDCRFIKLLK
jgi:ABC-2 type transport system permease protein